MFNCVFVSLQCGILGQVWYLIVSIPDLSRLSYFVTFQCGVLGQLWCLILSRPDLCPFYFNGEILAFVNRLEIFNYALYVHALTNSCVVVTHVHLYPCICFQCKTESESKRSIYLQYFPRKIYYYDYSIYIMIKVIKFVVLTIHCLTMFKNKQSKSGCKDQESIQSSTTLDPGYQWESDKLTVRHHKQEPRDQPFPSR